jgi:hypothetical protein
MVNFPIRNNFAQNYGLCVLRDQSAFIMRQLVGASRDELIAWASGATLVPRPVSRTLMLYSALFMGNLGAVEKIRDAHQRATAQPKHDAHESVYRLLADSGLLGASGRAGELATLLGVPGQDVSAWARREAPPPGYLRTFLMALASLDRDMRASVSQAVGVVAPSVRGAGIRDAEFRLAMAVCGLSASCLAIITGAQSTTIVDCMIGRSRASRALWTILSLYSVAPVDVVEVLFQRGASGLSGADGSLRDAIASIGLNADGDTDLCVLAVLLNVAVSDIASWLDNTCPPPPELWALFLLLAHLEPRRRFRFIGAFVDPVAAATEGDGNDRHQLPSGFVGIGRPKIWLH